MEALSPGHLIVLVVVLLFVFGAKRLPELGRGIGHGMREFQRGLKGHEDEPAPPAPPEPGAREQSPAPGA